MSDEKIHPVLDEEKPMHERMASLPDIPALPECTCQTLAVSHNPAIPPQKVLCLVCSALQEIDITREDFELVSFAAATFKTQGLLDTSLTTRIIQLERELQRSEKRRLEAARCSRVRLDEKRALEARLSPSGKILNKALNGTLQETLALVDQLSDRANAADRVLAIVNDHEGIPSIEWEDDEREVLRGAGVID